MSGPPAGPGPGPPADDLREARLDAARAVARALVHQVNNRLNPVVAAAFLLERRADDPAAVRELAGRVARAAEACAADLARLAPFLRAEPPAPGHLVAFDLGRLTERALDDARARWAAAGPADGRPAGAPAVDAALPAGHPVGGGPDEVRLAGAELLENAAEAAPPGGRIAVRVGGDGCGAWVEVADAGPGLDPAVAGRVGEPYATTKPAGGAGLGLAAVDGVMRRHRGSLAVTSSPAGTRVRLTFPGDLP